MGIRWVALSDIGYEIHNYVTVQDWAEKFDIGIDKEGKASQHANEVFQQVKLELIRQGKPVGRHHFAGHFIGHPGEQAINVYYNVQTAISLLAQARNQLEAISQSGEWDVAMEFLKGRLIPARLLTLLMATPAVLPENYAGAVPSHSVQTILALISTWEDELPAELKFRAEIIAEERKKKEDEQPERTIEDFEKEVSKGDE